MPERDQPTGGYFDGKDHRFALRVYFEDTDLSGIVYHANYQRYMERARSDMLRCAGIDQRAAFDAGEGAYAVRRMTIDFVAPAKLDDALLVVSRLTHLRGAAVNIHQTVMREHAILAEADVEVAFVAPNGRPRRQPSDWVAAFTPLIAKGN